MIEAIIKCKELVEKIMVPQHGSAYVDTLSFSLVGGGQGVRLMGQTFKDYPQLVDTNSGELKGKLMTLADQGLMVEGAEHDGITYRFEIDPASGTV